MADHAGPCGYQIQIQKLGTNKSSHNPDTPHTDQITHQWRYCLAHTLKHTLNNNGHTIERFRNRNHSQYRSTQQNNLCIFGKQAHHLRRKQEQQSAGNCHHNNFQENIHLCQIFDPAIIFGAVGITGQGCGCCAHAVTGDIEC